MLLVECGAYRTGSTAQYNLVGVYVEAAGLGRRLGLIEPDDVAMVDVKVLAPHGCHVAKCHHVVAGFRPFDHPTAWADLVLAGTARPIGTIRDEQDVRASMCRKFDLRPDELETSLLWREALANTRRWEQLGAIWQSYDVLIGDPEKALRQLVAALGMPWDPTAARVAVEGSGVAAALAIMNSLDRGTYDPVTLLHWDHVGQLEAAGREARQDQPLSSLECPPP